MTDDASVDVVARVRRRALELLGSSPGSVNYTPAQEPAPTEPAGSVPELTGFHPAPGEQRSRAIEETTLPAEAGGQGGKIDGSQGLGFEPYVEADLARFAKRGTLGDEPDSVLHPMILEIIAVEGPAHFETLLERLRLRYGMGRAREPTRRHVLRSIARLQAARLDISLDRLDAGSNLFLFRTGEPVRPRSPGLRGTRRIGYIASSEISAGVLAYMDREDPIDRSELIRMVREGFGYRRTGDDIHAAIDGAVGDLLNARILEDRGGRLHRIADSI